MNCRRHGSKPTLALWMLVAVADVALIAATAGVFTMLLLAAALVTIGVAVVGIRQLARQDATASDAVPASMTARRRA